MDSEKRHSGMSRRSFLRDAGILGGGAWLASQGSAQGIESSSAAALPQRVFGKTNQSVSVLALGTAPCGQSESIDTPAVMAIVREALELGINFIDTARIYGNAEEGIGKALGSDRQKIFLATKVWADDADGARRSLERSLRELQTDYVDLVYLHSMGNRNAERALEDDGALSYLIEQKRAGSTRFVGISGHSRVESFLPVIESGRIDAVMTAMNFVDRFTYNFEEKVLPVARSQDLGIACMKVFGGIRGGFGSYSGPNPGPQMEPRHLKQAIRYAMGLPAVATLVIGPHTVEQLRENVQTVRSYEPLSEAEHVELAELGRGMAAQWGPHYGPVV